MNQRTMISKIEKQRQNLENENNFKYSNVVLAKDKEDYYYYRSRYVDLQLGLTKVNESELKNIFENQSRIMIFDLNHDSIKLLKFDQD